LTVDGNTLAQARRKAKAHLGDVAKGRDPLATEQKKRDARKHTLRKVVEEEFYTHKAVRNLRSLDEIKGTFNRYIFPSLGCRPVSEIKRSEIIKMLEGVENKNGPGAANNAYKVLRRFFTWFASRSDNFNSPIVKRHMGGDDRRRRPHLG